MDRALQTPGAAGADAGLGFASSERGGEIWLPRLIVGDESSVHHSHLQHQLGKHFDIAGVATDAERLVDLARDHRPDAALLEVCISGGGVEATRGIRAASPDTAVVILSHDEFRPTVLMLLRAGAVCYLRKGIEPGDLADRLHEAIAAHRQAPGEFRRAG